MFWDGDRWLPDDGQPIAQPQRRFRRRFRHSISAGILALALVGLMLPTTGVMASTSPARTLLATWPTGSRVTTYQETSRRISYRGAWTTARNASYLGGKVRATNAGRASATLTFRGAAVSWVGPIGPTGGKAKVYIDGKLVKTVNTWASRFRPTSVLFQKSWNAAGAHSIKIVTLGTRGHPTVAIDALFVRLNTVAPTPAPATSTRVTSIPALLTALANNAVTDIVVANGTYRVSPAASQASNSLWIGSRFAGRTHPVTVRAETRGGVTFDGGGAAYFGGISFEQGAHDQTWDGFVFANGTPTSTGVVMFGGYYDGSAAPHHITMRNLRFLPSIKGTIPQDHAFYISATSAGTGGPHDLLFEDIYVDGSGGLMSAFNFGHNPGDSAWNVTVRRLTAVHLDTAIVVWEGVLHDLLFEDITLTNSSRFGVRYENGSDYRIVFRNVTSTGSGTQGFYSSLGNPPPGVTFVGDSFH